METPTQDELDTAIEVIQAIIDHTKEHEPCAVSFIKLAEDFRLEMPTTVDAFNSF